MKHTPGPWNFSFDADGDHAIFCGEKLIAVTVGLDHFSREVDEDHARLIAAAPELLEGLKVMVTIARQEDWHKAFTGRQIVLEEAEAAIAKAEGQQ